MDNAAAKGERPQIKFISKPSDDYRLEFINGAISNITPRGEIVCDFHFESKDRPTEQLIEGMNADGSARLSPFNDTGIISRDVKFGIIINLEFAKDLVTLINTKISECEALHVEIAKAGQKK